jgi:hypothetical protein
MAGVWTGREGLIFDIMAQRIDRERSLEYDGLSVVFTAMRGLTRYVSHQRFRIRTLP